METLKFEIEEISNGFLLHYRDVTGEEKTEYLETKADILKEIEVQMRYM